MAQIDDLLHIRLDSSTGSWVACCVNDNLDAAPYRSLLNLQTHSKAIFVRATKYFFVLRYTVQNVPSQCSHGAVPTLIHSTQHKGRPGPTTQYVHSTCHGTYCVGLVPRCSRCNGEYPCSGCRVSDPHYLTFQTLQVLPAVLGRKKAGTYQLTSAWNVQHMSFGIV